MKATLRILTGGHGQEISIAKGQCVIGRGGDADIRIDDGTVSRHHCRLTFANGRWMIEDLSSSNGTFRGVRRVKKSVRLRSGQRFRIGQVSLALDYVKAPIHPLTWLVGGMLAAGLIIGGTLLFKEYVTGKRRVLLPGGGGGIVSSVQRPVEQAVDVATFMPVSGQNDIEMQVPPLPDDPGQKMIRRTVRISGRLRPRR